MSTYEIRPATEGDLPAILEIYNEVIATSTAVYSLVPSTLEDRRAWFQARTGGGYPVLVAAGPDGVLGFSTFGEFRGAWAGYRYSVEHSVHVRADQRGRGVGSRLIEALFPYAAAMGKHVILGAIDAANEGSLRLHERLGFERVAHFREVGHKFGRWLDLVFVQRFVDGAGAPRQGS
ncbi:MAG TPA: GNAT family N-acetyltransferase [Anaeromyxobacteraceae bacterium]|nr:GNAT family N-acetyltransferase [Anaeromyxobacteraceae bacterium]